MVDESVDAKSQTLLNTVYLTLPYRYPIILDFLLVLVLLVLVIIL